MHKQIKGDALISSKVLRDSVMNKLDVLDKVKKLSTLPGDMLSTIEQATDYFEVSRETINSLIKDNREELEANGLKVLKGNELMSFKDMGVIGKNTSSFTIIPRKAMLNIGMLLKKSVVARQIREYLLHVEEVAQEQAPEVIDNALVRQKIKDLEMKEARLEIQKKNAAVRQAKLMMEFTKEYKDKLSSESITAMLNAATTVLTGQPLLPPPVIDKTYTAEEIGKELGISSNMVGKIANKHNLKVPEYGISILGKSKHSDKQFPQWIYYEAGRKAIIEIVKNQAM